MLRRLDVRLGFALLAATLAVYAPVLTHSFLDYDDSAYVTHNRTVQSGLSLAGCRWAWTTFHASNWHPLTWLSHMLDCQLFGLHPAGHHLTSVLFHLANALLLFLVLRCMTAAPWRSALVAGVFALHPLHVESVAWVAERKDVLSTFFGLLALGAYLHYVERPGPARYALVLGAFALSLLAKPMLVTLPFVLLLLDYWPLRRFPAEADQPPGPDETPPRPVPLPRLLLEKVPLLVLSVASCAVTLWAQSGHAVVSLERVPLGARLANAVLAYAGYLRKTVWPVDLAVFYPHPGAQVPWGQVLVSGLVLAVVTGLAVGLRRRQPALLVGWLWYLGTLVPVIGLVQVGGQSMADRYTYFPLIGIFLALAWCVPGRLAARPAARVGLAVGAATVLAACALVTHSQLASWQDEGTVWEHALRVTENNAVAHLYLGTYLYNQGGTGEGVEHLREAARLDPGNALALHNLGLAQLQDGDTDGALELLTRAVALDPQVGLYENSLGLALVRKGRVDEAGRAFREAVRLAPEEAEPHFNLAAALDDQGDHRGATAAYQAGLRLEPKWPAQACRRAVALLQADDPARRSPPEALWRARQANGAAGGRDPDVLALLAEAYAANGRMTEALAAVRRAIALARADDPDLVSVLQEAARRYEQASPGSQAP
jgi:tetratricopeptide (TPR) repeat protein